MIVDNTLAFARQSDAEDPLRHFRDQFFIPAQNGKPLIYLNGNSLGLQPKNVSKYIQQELDDWAKLGVEGHFHAKNPWLSYHEIFPPLLAPIIGCRPDEVVVMNQLTVNLHLMMVSFYRPNKNRYRIICEAKAFPSDQYALESQVLYHGFKPEDAIIEIEPAAGKHTLDTADILSVIRKYGDSVALVLMGGVNYYTGQFYDLKAITECAHSVGAYAGFDLAHAAGNVPLRLHEWDIDFATWCSYKYLNSGPGSVSGIFIHQKHVNNFSLPRFAGWWGHDKEKRFRMEKGFRPIPTAEGWQLSNAPILSMAAHKAALEVFEQAGMERLHEKRIKLSAYLHGLLNKINNQKTTNPIEIITPANEQERGCQVSMLVLEKGKEIFQELISKGVIADWREPNVIRVAPVPLYNSYEDVWTFVHIIETILAN